MNSPFSGKPMILQTEWLTLPYRKDEFKVKYHNYYCEDSGKQFTIDAVDDLNIIQVHNQYREKYGIPYIEDIIRIRHKYDISSAKISELLGFGTNSYRLYENGEMPSVSNGRMIQTIDQPEEFIKQVKLSTHLLSAKEVDKLILKAMAVQSMEQKNDNGLHLIPKVNSLAYSGYKKVNSEKIVGLIVAFNSKIELYKTKLNKLLFYADFAHYKQYGQSITGLAYRAIDLGPVPASYHMMYSILMEKNKIDIVQKLFDNGNYGELIKPITSNPASELSESEQRIMDLVVNRFYTLNSKDIVDLSHSESGWLENHEKKSLINYQEYAFDLKAI